MIAETARAIPCDLHDLRSLSEQKDRKDCRYQHAKSVKGRRDRRSVLSHAQSAKDHSHRHAHAVICSHQERIYGSRFCSYQRIFIHHEKSNHSAHYIRSHCRRISVAAVCLRKSHGEHDERMSCDSQNQKYQI